jgi:DNA mismatch repair ATPase MutS
MSIREYIKEIKPKKVKNFLDNLGTVMNQVVHGHNEAKRHIIQMMGQQVRNPNSKGNMLGIWGPPGNGKTTIIKSTLINIIFTQQFGCGFFDYAKFKPFKHLHCYLNIPDTSGRDSLFQAEARRCKEIIDIISDNKKDSHFCLFDELYSGTNPEEAEKSATSFMLYLNKIKNVSTMLTTHFIKICDKLNDEKEIQNYKMVTEQENKKLVYKYKLEKGISKVKGVINVLTDLNYPKEIIDDIYEITNNK